MGCNKGRLFTLAFSIVFQKLLHTKTPESTIYCTKENCKTLQHASFLSGVSPLWNIFEMSGKTFVMELLLQVHKLQKCVEKVLNDMRVQIMTTFYIWGKLFFLFSTDGVGDFFGGYCYHCRSDPSHYCRLRVWRIWFIVVKSRI